MVQYQYDAMRQQWFRQQSCDTMLHAMSHTMVKNKLILSTPYCFSFYDKSIIIIIL